MANLDSKPAKEVMCGFHREADVVGDCRSFISS